MKYKIIGLFILTAVIFSGAVSFSYATSPIPYEGDTFTRNLTIGSLGYEVVALQSWLEQKGFLTMLAGVQKGYFGGLTRAALIKFQLSQGITPPVGYFGPITRGILNALNEPDNKLKVISPNGGEVLQRDSIFRVQWSGTTEKKVYLSLFNYSDPCNTQTQICPLSLSPVRTYPTSGGEIDNTGFFDWKVGRVKDNFPMPQPAIPDGKYILRVSAQGAGVQGTTDYDDSNSYFEITSNVSQIKITPDILPDAFTEAPYYSVKIQALNFTDPVIEWSIIGALPAGFYLTKAMAICPMDLNSNSTCVAADPYAASIGGRPLQAGTYSFTVKATGQTQSVTKSYTLTVKKGYSLSIDKQIYSKNEPINIVFKAFNDSDTARSITFSNGACQLWYRINKADNPGSNIFDSLNPSMCSNGEVTVNIPPHGVHTWTLTHPANSLQPGSYKIFASLSGHAYITSDPITITN